MCSDMFRDVRSRWPVETSWSSQLLTARHSRWSASQHLSSSRVENDPIKWSGAFWRFTAGSNVTVTFWDIWYNSFLKDKCWSQRWNLTIVVATLVKWSFTNVLLFFCYILLFCSFNFHFKFVYRVPNHHKIYPKAVR